MMFGFIVFVLLLAETAVLLGLLWLKGGDPSLGREVQRLNRQVTNLQGALNLRVQESGERLNCILKMEKELADRRDEFLNERMFRDQAARRAFFLSQRLQKIREQLGYNDQDHEDVDANLGSHSWTVAAGDEMKPITVEIPELGANEPVGMN